MAQIPPSNKHRMKRLFILDLWCNDGETTFNSGKAPLLGAGYWKILKIFSRNYFSYTYSFFRFVEFHYIDASVKRTNKRK